MPSPEQRTISLPAEHASYIDALVASGAYATPSDVVEAGLHALQERDGAVEQWLRADFPERGTRRDDLWPGLRTMGFERRVTIAFTVALKS